MIISFSGHRPNKIGGYKTPNPTYNYICKEIEKHLIALKPEKVIVGGALGVDTWAANIAYKLKIPFILAVPFKGQELAWPPSSQNIYNRMLEKSLEVVIVSDGGYSAAKMQIRNQWMVDRADILIGIWNGSTGGTGNCINYAKSKNKKIILIDPKNAIIK